MAEESPKTVTITSNNPLRAEAMRLMPMLTEEPQ